MPYRIEERDGQFCVMKGDETIHCHKTQAGAEAQMKALYANEKGLMYVPFTKVDDEQRMVYGLATDETPDVENEVVDYEATKRAVADWSKWRNVRAMHAPHAVGVAEEIALDDAAKSLSIGVKVVDDDAWAKVKAGVYKGFSIGGRKLKAVMEKVGDRKVNRILEYLLTEISLVDRPANPAAVFSLVKREGGETSMEPEEKTETQETATEAVEKGASEEAQEETQEQTEPPAVVTPETVKALIAEALQAAGLSKEAFAEATEVGDLVKSVQGLASVPDALQKAAGDLAKVVGDLAKVAQTVDDLDDRVTRIEKMPAGTGPVLREIQATGAIDQSEAVLKALFDETTDPALKDLLGRKLTEMSIRSAKRNVMNP